MTETDVSLVETEPGVGPVTIKTVEKIIKAELVIGGKLINLAEVADPSMGTPWKLGKGLMTIYFCDVFDGDGELIGKSAGSMIILGEDPETGHLMEHITEQIQLADGTITAWGTHDRTDVLQQKWSTYRAEGTSGRYLGLTGTRSYRIYALDDPTFPLDGVWELG